MTIQKIFSLFLLLSLSLNSCKSFRQEKIATADDPGQYQWVSDWPQLPVGYALGNPTGICIDTNQNVFIFHRAGRTWPLISAMPDSYILEKTILLLDGKTGKILNSWGDSCFVMPHGLTVDSNNNVWVTDVKGNRTL